MKLDITERKRIESRVVGAVERGEIRPFFQPLVDLKRDGYVVGFEALARWYDSDFGLVMPDKFINAAERVGAMDDITISMMESVCAAARKTPSDVVFAINLSPSFLVKSDSAQRLIRTADRHGIDLRRFEFEVTENILISDVETARSVLMELRSRGASIALDDFGAGYSSLQYIRSLPFDKVKIDRMYVSDMSENDGSTIVNAVLSLAASLAFTTTAEGIEDEHTAAMLTMLGCMRGQGWLYGKPVPEKEMLRIVRERSDVENAEQGTLRAAG